MENKNITLSSQELKEIFKKSISPFAEDVKQLKKMQVYSLEEIKEALEKYINTQPKSGLNNIFTVFDIDEFIKSLIQ